MSGNRSGLSYFLLHHLSELQDQANFLGTKFLNADAVKVLPLILEHSGSDMPIFSSITFGCKSDLSEFKEQAECDSKILMGSE